MDGEEGSKITVALLEGHSKSPVGIQHGRIELEHMVFVIQVIDDVKQGSPMSQALAKTEIFEGMFTSIIYVGEESGALDEILEKTADYYEEEADAAVTRLVGLMEPLLIVFMGLAIGICLAGVFPLLYGSLEGLENS